jgi:hypothetical protein
MLLLILLFYSPSASPELHTAWVGFTKQKLVAPFAMSGRPRMLAMHITATAASLQSMTVMLSYAAHGSSFFISIIFLMLNEPRVASSRLDVRDVGRRWNVLPS